MTDGQTKLIEMAVQLAARLPGEIVDIVHRAILQSPDSASPQARARLAHDIPHPYYRDIATDFVICWQRTAPDLSPQQAALCLLTAAQSEEIHQKRQSIEPVWTGPEVEGVPFRRTEQAILQVLDGATERILLVSYAVYRIPRICQALVRAARRGVQINVVVETPHLGAGQNEYNTLQALGEEVAHCATVYYWPEERRDRDNEGKPGILHVKCAVADGRQLFLSSANLTEYAFTINMELGLLITGGHLPGQVERQFDGLITAGVFKRV